jgi:hypothetical protein
VAAVGGAVAAIWSVKSNASAQAAQHSADGAHTIAAAALTSIKDVGVHIDGRMTQLLAAKDELTEARVAGSFKEGVAQEKDDAANKTKQ